MNGGSSQRATGSLRERQREAVTAAILDAAEAVVDEHGLAAPPMAEIARRAGVAVGTVYNYFPDRDGLIRALLHDRRAALVPRLRAAAEAHAKEPFEAALRGFLRDCLTLMEERRAFLRIAFELRPPGRLTDKERAVVNELRASLTAILGRRRRAPARVALEVRVVAAAVRAAILDGLEHGRRFTDDVDALVDLLLDGLGRR